MINVFTAPEKLAGLGFALPWVYRRVDRCFGVALSAVPLLAGLKARRRDWWLSYL
jgi:hypothetical protein